MATRHPVRERYSFANLPEPIEIPDLIADSAVESFEWFLHRGTGRSLP